MIGIINALRKKRAIFHSEADFQFSLAWEIQLRYPDAAIRLEYPPLDDPTKYIDVLVYLGTHVFPIELKYKTKLHSSVVGGESYLLKNHGAQDIGKHDFVKDLYRIENFRDHIVGFQKGYAIWLTNDPHYWAIAKSDTAGYSAFSVHHGSIKSGTMAWGPSVGDGTRKSRENPLNLSGCYQLDWQEYSTIEAKNGIFKYAVTILGAPTP